MADVIKKLEVDALKKEEEGEGDFSESEFDDAEMAEDGTDIARDVFLPSN